MFKLSSCNKKFVTYSLLFVVVLTFGISFCFSYFKAAGSVNSVGTFNILSFAPKVNNNSSFTQNIDLNNTITNNKNLAPGSEGNFDINVDFTNVDYSVSYNITYDNTNIPTNMHFYTDSSYTNSLTSIGGTMSLQSSNKVVSNTIYWKWEYINDSISNSNDSLYNNQLISVPFTVNVIQQLN